MIPVIQKNYTCTASGEVFKFVECENCRFKYVYRMKRTVRGEGTSFYLLDNAGAENRARSRAESELHNQLIHDCDPIPCLKCGWYQANMQAKIRSEYRLWIFWTGIGFLIAMVAFALMAYTESYGQKKLITEFFSASVACGFVGIAAILLRKLQAFRLHPNSTPAKDRIVIGKWNPQSLDDFENAQKIAASGPEQN